ncbi:MAG: hypothetical protein AB2L24_00910 [Mangrovibacterium sp.]|jgi:hypothetical protein
MKTMVKFVKTLCLLSIIGISVISVYAQKENTVLDKLQGKKWFMATAMDGDKIVNWTESKYEKDKVLYYFNGQLFGMGEYYLSDSIVTVFDQNKVGKVINGRYIVSRILRDKTDTRPTPIGVLEIVELGSDKMVVKNNNQPNVLLEYKAK